MPHSVVNLVAQADLGLKILVTGRRAQDDIAWVASSDLLDPTPFLDVGNLVLTTGRQFGTKGPADFDGYIARLQHVGVVGVGFGTEVLRATPGALVRACAAAGMTLIEVPYRTPFLAVIRWVAAQIEREAHSRDEWALDTLRAVSTAALTGDVSAPLAELAARLDGSVMVFDRSGRPSTAVGPTRPRDDTIERLAVESRRLLLAGRRASAVLSVGDATATFQTLGPGGGLAGVIVVVAGGPLDRAARLVLNTAVALLEVSSVHESRARDLRNRLGDRAVEFMARGDQELAHALFAATGGRLPAEPLVVIVSTFTSAVHREATRAAMDGSGAMTAIIGDRLTTVAPGRTWRRRAEQIASSGGRSGVVADVTWADAGIAFDRATSALLRTSDENPVVEWGTGGQQAMETVVNTPAVVAYARAAVRTALADETGEELVRYAEVWLAHGGHWDASARALGVHRHTLKNRIRFLGTLLGLDLETFAGKVELHILLTAAR